ncbi:MAG: FMN-binding protein [Bacteroidales bacterium]|nr:FMN-binding protein [Bacteroidales bacterium]
MNTQSNGYTVVYSAIMVVVVAAALTLIAVGLKPFQQANIDNEKRQNILKSAGITAEGSIEDAYNKYVKESFVVDLNGATVSGAEAFKTDLDVKGGKLPVYVIDKNGQKLYVVPLKGNGLWGPIWGFASLKEDFNTIEGVVFDHASETPGLGAEMTQQYFCDQFKGRELAEGAAFAGIKQVYKGNPKDPSDDQDPKHGIDAISGSTMTTNGVQAMVNDCLKAYDNFRAKVSGKGGVSQSEKKVDEISDAPQAQVTNVNE